MNSGNKSATRKLGDLGPLIHLAQTYPKLDASEKEELLSRYEITNVEMRYFTKAVENINL